MRVVKPRPLDGTDIPATVEPEQLLMDGQQRLTSLYQALGWQVTFVERLSEPGCCPRWR